jgi:hypothetical protein
MSTSLSFTQMSRKLQKEIEVSVQETYLGIEYHQGYFLFSFNI